MTEADIIASVKRGNLGDQLRGHLKKMYDIDSSDLTAGDRNGKKVLIYSAVNPKQSTQDFLADDFLSNYLIIEPGIPTTFLAE